MALNEEPGAIDPSGDDGSRREAAAHQELIRVHCPQCHKRHKMMPSLLGRLVICQRCQHRFKAAPDRPPAEPVRTPDPAVAPEEPSSVRLLLTGVAERIESEFTKLQAENRDLKERLESLRSELIAARSDKQSIQEESEGLRANLAAAVSESAALAVEIQSLRSEIADEQAGFARHRAHLEKQEREALDEVARLNATLDSTIEANAAEAKRAREESDAKLKEVAEAGDLQARTLEEEVGSLRQQAEIDREQNERLLSELQIELATREAERTRLEYELGLLQDQIARDGSLHEAQRDDHNALVERHGRLEEDHEQLRREYAELGENQRIKIQQLGDERDRASARLDELTQTSHLTDIKLREALADLDRERAARANERAAWSGQLEEKSRALVELKEQQGRMRLTPAAASSQTVRPDGRRVMLETELAEKNAELARLKAAAVEAQHFREQMERFLSGMGIRLPA